MIAILALIACYTLLARRAGLASFECAVIAIISMPISFYGLMRIADYFGWHASANSVYLFLIVLNFLILSVLAKINSSHRDKTSPLLERSDLEILSFFTCTFLLCYSLCLTWPDFIALGERLRDFSLLASLSSSPVYPKEPWLSGVSLNYYTYWYRFGQIFTLALNESLPSTYHLLQSFTYALFVSLCFRIARYHLKLSILVSLCFSVIIGFGSNFGGLKHLIQPGPNWWWPTRIIPGGIHEFPVWSLILGDAHPHYLNLPMIPLGITLWMTLQERSAKTTYWAYAYLTLLVALFMRAANAWEVPMWLGISTATILLSLLLKRKQNSSIETLYDRITAGKLLKRLIWTIILLFICLLLFEMGSNFQSIPVSLRLVAEPIARTDLRDLMAHWGFPLFALLSANAIILGPKKGSVLLVCLLSSSLFFSNALPFLLILLLASIFRLSSALLGKDEMDNCRSKHRAILESCGLCAIGLIICPEILYLDDPYGGIHERMNTIFKLYYPAWFLIYLHVAYLLQISIPKILPLASKRWIITQGPRVLLLGLTLLSCSFFLKTIPERKSYVGNTPSAHGLDTLERKYPGVSGLIDWLSKQEPSVVLEVQHSAYSEGTLIATLSGQTAYLGWVNHVQLLYPGHSELIQHRIEVAKRFYDNLTCSERLSIVQSERIDFVALGPIESKHLDKMPKQDFSCLETVYQSGAYQLLKAPIP